MLTFYVFIDNQLDQETTLRESERDVVEVCENLNMFVSSVLLINIYWDILTYP